MKRFIIITILVSGIGARLLSQPVINSFNPKSGVINTVVTIIGNGFSTIASNNVVYFGVTKAKVNAATASSLSVTVPAGATFDPISVTVNNLTGYSRLPFIVTFTGGGSAFSTSSYAARQDFAAGIDPRAISTADIDGDGKLDFTIANFTGGSFSVFRNTTGSSGVISFAPRLDFILGPGGDHDEPYKLTFADIDGDGKLDIIIPRYGVATVSIFKNTSTVGTVSFAAPLDLAVGNNGPVVTATADVDKDGKTDILVTSIAPVNRLSIFRNTTSGGIISFAPEIHYSFSGPGYPFDIAAIDLDADGKVDICTANAQGNNISVYRNTSTVGNISLAPKVDYDTRIDVTKEANPYYLAAGDLDADGKPDIAVANGGDGNNHNHHISVFRNTSSTGAITFASRIDFATDIIPSTISVNDLNGDGKLDLHASNLQGNKVYLFRNVGNAPGSISFDTHVDFTTPATPRSTLGDLNNDGKPEMITVNAGANSVSVYKSQVPNPRPPHHHCHSFSPLHGMAGTSMTITGDNFNSIRENNVVYFGATQAEVTNSTSTTLTVTVPNGSTFEPISVITNEQVAITPQVYNLTFTGGGSINSNSFGPKDDYPTGTGPRKFSVADFDGDGKPDIATANESGQSVSLLLNTSAGNVPSFAAKLDYSLGTATSTSAGDIDGDGKPDLTVTNYPNLVSVFRNTSMQGTLSFDPKIDFVAGGNPTQVEAMDIDGDGQAELIVLNSSDNSLSIFRNTSITGSISFAPKVNVGLAGVPGGFAVADLNGDNKPDLAVVNALLGTISVFQNTSSTGTVSFGSPVSLTITGNSGADIVAGDLDGDGKPDLALVITNSNMLSIFRNTSAAGSMSFASRIDITTSSAPVSVSIANLDGDELPDLLVENSSTNTISVFRNIGSSGFISFGSRIDFITGLNPRFALAADLGSDGKSEIIVSNATSNSISVLSNYVDLALPIQLFSFNGRTNSNNNVLEWSATNDNSAGHFELERSIDGVNYARIASINPTISNTTIESYSYTDDLSALTINVPVYYYRLKIINGDGHFTYSATVKLRIAGKNDFVEVARNPFKNSLSININSGRSDRANIVILDIQGRQLLSKTYELRKGNNAIKFNEMDKVSAGVYILKVITGDNQQSVKIIKE